MILDGLVKDIYEKGGIDLYGVLEQAADINRALNKGTFKVPKNIIISVAPPGSTSIEKTSFDTVKINLDLVYAVSNPDLEEKNKILTYLVAHELFHPHRGDLKSFDIVMHAIISKLTDYNNSLIGFMLKSEITASDAIIDSKLLHNRYTLEGFYLTHIPEYWSDRINMDNFENLSKLYKNDVSLRILRRHVLARYAKDKNLPWGRYKTFNSNFIIQYHNHLHGKLNNNQREEYGELCKLLSKCVRTKRITIKYKDVAWKFYQSLMGSNFENV